MHCMLLPMFYDDTTTVTTTITITTTTFTTLNQQKPASIPNAHQLHQPLSLPSLQSSGCGPPLVPVGHNNLRIRVRLWTPHFTAAGIEGERTTTIIKYRYQRLLTVATIISSSFSSLSVLINQTKDYKHQDR